MTELTFTLPWPPTVNTYWRHGVIGGKNCKARASVFLSEKGKQYQVDALAALKLQRVPTGALFGRLDVHAIAYPPDERTRDVDNLWKGMLDALKHAKIITDDGHIDRLLIERGPVCRPDGIVRFVVREKPEAFESRQQGFDLTEPIKPAPNTGAPF